LVDFRFTLKFTQREHSKASSVKAKVNISTSSASGRQPENVSTKKLM